jgi:hypothetical protein
MHIYPHTLGFLGLQVNKQLHTFNDLVYFSSRKWSTVLEVQLTRCEKKIRYMFFSSKTLRNIHF